MIPDEAAYRRYLCGDQKAAELLEGHTLAIIEEDGAEAPIELEIEEGTAAFTLDFTDSQRPAQVIRLVPEA